MTTVKGLAASPASRSWAAASSRADTTLNLGGWSRSHSGMNLDAADRILENYCRVGSIHDDLR